MRIIIGWVILASTYMEVLKRTADHIVMLEWCKSMNRYRHAIILS